MGVRFLMSEVPLQGEKRVFGVRVPGRDPLVAIEALVLV